MTLFGKIKQGSLKALYTTIINPWVSAALIASVALAATMFGATSFLIAFAIGLCAGPLYFGSVLIARSAINRASNALATVMIKAVAKAIIEDREDPRLTEGRAALIRSTNGDKAVTK